MTAFSSPRGVRVVSPVFWPLRTGCRFSSPRGVRVVSILRGALGDAEERFRPLAGYELFRAYLPSLVFVHVFVPSRGTSCFALSAPVSSSHRFSSPRGVRVVSMARDAVKLNNTVFVPSRGTSCFRRTG